MSIFHKSSVGKQFMILLLIIAGSLLFFTLLGILLAIPFIDEEVLLAINRMGNAETPQDIALLKYFQIISQIGLFVASSFFFALLVSKKPLSYLKLNKAPKLTLIGVALLIGLISSPFLNWIMELNSQAHLPQFMSSIENWMREMEIEASRLTELFLSGTSLSSLAVNLLMMALLAGLGEELLLRGIVQPLFIKLTNNAHAGIWIAAALFSLMHFQFFGFFPRLLLGALFGYYFYWSRNLWIPIIAHILNNGFIVLYTFYVGKVNLTPSFEESNTTESSSPLLIILSISLTFAGLLFFYREGLKQTNKNS